MAGLNLNAGASVRAGSGAEYSSKARPSTAAEAGFGPGYTVPGTPSSTRALAPNDPFGVAFWGGVACLGLLLLLRHSLPA